MKTRRPVNCYVRLLTDFRCRHYLVRAVECLSVLLVLFGLCVAQQPQTSNQAQKTEPNVAVDYGSLFYVYGKSVSIKTQNESLDGFRPVLKGQSAF